MGERGPQGSTRQAGPKRDSESAVARTVRLLSERLYVLRRPLSCMSKPTVWVLAALLVMSMGAVAQDNSNPDGGDSETNSDDSSGNTTTSTTTTTTSTTSNRTTTSTTTSTTSTPTTSSPPPTTQPCDGPHCASYCKEHYDTTDREKCKREFCHDHPERAACQSEPRPGDNPNPNDKSQSGRGDQSHPDENSGRPEPTPMVCPEVCQFRHLSFELVQDPLGGRNFTVGGRLVLDSFEVPMNQPYKVIRKGASVEVHNNEQGYLSINDNFAGLLTWKGDGAMTLRFPPGSILKDTGIAIHVTLPDGTKALVRSDASTIDGTTVMGSKFVALYALAGDALRDAPRDGPRLMPRINSAQMEDAISRGKVGAVVEFREKQLEKAEILPYDDVNVTLLKKESGATRVVVGSELSEGRTIVLDFDAEALGTTNPNEVLLRYFDLHDDGSETEVVFAMAEGGMNDVLDATDDNGRPEYWVVSDADGVHILVSVPHWSVHAIDVLVAFITQPSVVAGVIAGITGAGIAWLVMLVPRRRE